MINQKCLDYLIIGGGLPLLKKHLVERIQMVKPGGEQGRCSTGNMEIDYHANMVVIGGEITTIQQTGKFSDVNAFAADFSMMPRVLIVDVAIAYDFPHSGEVFLIVAKKSLYIKSMDHNLVPLFITQESGLYLNEQAKIHSSEPPKEHHSI